MFKKNKKTKRIIIALVSFLEIFALNIFQAQALHLPSPSEVAGELEERYHIDLGSVQNFSEGANVSSTKNFAPQVSLFFQPSDPKPGEKLTATASPMFFSNPNEDLYYTWYLKHKSGNKDWNGDGNIDIDDYKIEAARIIAQGDFYPSNFDYNTSNNDHDGYQAYYGGDNMEGAPSHCYIHDFDSGIDAEMVKGCRHLFPDAPGHTTGDNSFDVDEEKFWGTDPNDPDTAKTGNNDEANVAGLGQATFTWNYEPGDEVGVAVEGVSMMPTKYDDSSSMIEWALPKNKCTTHSTETQYQVQCTDPNYPIPACVNTTNNIDLSQIGGNSNTNTALYSCVSTRENPQCIQSSAPTCSNGIPRCVASIGSDNVIDPDDANGNTGYEHACDSSQVYSIDNYFPALNLQPPGCVPQADNSGGVQTGSKTIESKGYTVVIPTTNIDINDCLDDNFVDPMQGGQAGKLDVSLSYTPDNPVNDPTTDNSGDVVSVQASVGNSEQNTNQQLYDWSVSISTDGTFNGKFRDITSALVNNNLVSGPTQGNGVSALNFQLNLNPTNLGISQQVFNTYFPSGVGYLNVVSKVSENFASGSTQYGQSNVIIKVTSSDKKIVAYNTRVNSDGTMVIDDADNSNVICATSGTCYVTKGQIIGVKVNGSGLSNFSWALNNNTMTCDSLVSSADCKIGTATNYNFFPVMGNVGDTYTLTLTANDIGDTDTGKSITLQKNFQIVDPYLTIESADQNSVWPRWIGSYTDLNGANHDDLSDSVFETYPGNQMKFQAVFHPASIEIDTPIAWKIDGYDFPAADNTREITLAEQKGLGASYGISLSGVYTQPAEMKRALQTIWGISQFDSEDKNLSDDIQVQVVANPSISKVDSPKKFFAAVVGAVPENMIFLLRIFLTVGILIFVSRLIFSLNPNKSYEA
jgi:hypothetical protein